MALTLLKKIWNYVVVHSRKNYLLATKGTIGYARHLGVKIGDGCRIYISSWGSEPFLITIGDRVTITDDVKIITHNGSTWLARDEQGRRYDYQKVSIGSDVFIGSASIILPGVVIEDKVIIAAGAVVAKSIPSGSIVGGNPAKIIGKYDEYMANALANFPTESNRDKRLSYKDTIMHELNHSTKPYMTR